MNTEKLRARAGIVAAVRAELGRQGFTEVEVPVLVDGPAMEANLEAVRAADGWLHTSPEFSLKRAVAAGLWRVYAITPCFRGEEHGRHHRAEFTMLELYAVGLRYLDLIDVVEPIVAAAWAAVGRPAPQIARQTVAALFGGEIPGDDDVFFRQWVERIDPALTAPTWVLDFPARQAALAEVRGEVAERLELYLEGMEIANGYSELGNGDELRARFAESASVRRARGRAPHPMDEGVIAATARLPRCAGIAIGVDRLVMAATGAGDIADVRVPR
jgi:lysyl-tRNA synthetase class 2